MAQTLKKCGDAPKKRVKKVFNMKRLKRVTFVIDVNNYLSLESTFQQLHALSNISSNFIHGV